MTVPPATAWIGVPVGQARSTPAWYVCQYGEVSPQVAVIEYGAVIGLVHLPELSDCPAALPYTLTCTWSRCRLVSSVAPEGWSYGSQPLFLSLGLTDQIFSSKITYLTPRPAALARTHLATSQPY